MPPTPGPILPNRPNPGGGRPRVIQGSFVAGVPRLPASAAGGKAIQRARSHAATPLPADFGVRVRTPGRALPEVVQRQMESLFNASFADVRVHVGPEAGSIGALAFTQGSEIFFAPGQYNPDTAPGRRLLGHELAHVIQQRTGRARNPFGEGTAVVHDPLLRAEADRMAQRAAMPLPAANPARGPLQRLAAILPKRPGAAGPAPAMAGPVRASAPAPILPKRTQPTPATPTVAARPATPAAIQPRRPSVAPQAPQPIRPGTAPAPILPSSRPDSVLARGRQIASAVANRVGRWISAS